MLAAGYGRYSFGFSVLCRHFPTVPLALVPVGTIHLSSTSTEYIIVPLRCEGKVNIGSFLCVKMENQ